MFTDLIYDIGLHHGGDTRYYLNQGYRVVAVDAHSGFIARAQKDLVSDIELGRLRLVHAAIADCDGGEIDFHVSTNSDWCSVDANVAERQEPAAYVMKVPCRRLDSLFNQYGTPVYCKIDIEGADAMALEGLRSAPALPAFVSCEAECSGKERWSEDRSLHTLVLLHQLGYRKFKLVDQPSLRVIPAQGRFYRERRDAVGPIVQRISWRLGQWWDPDTRHRIKLRRLHGFSFEGDVTGPWGESLHGDWLNYQTATSIYRRHRRDYFERQTFTGFAFWVDWHARM